MRQISDDLLNRIIEESGIETPLDGDEVDMLVEHLRTRLNECQGNKTRHIASEEFISAYIEAMLWSSNDDNDVPLDDIYDREDLANETWEKVREICNNFVTDCINEELDFDELCERTLEEWSTDELAGNDLWLTSAGHGTGFWDDGRWANGDRLTELAKKTGEHYPYVGDDGLIYLT